MSRHREASARVAAPPEALFAHLDDQSRLGEHMGKSSMMMGGGRMAYEFDAGRGQAVGSHIRMSGRACGFDVFVDEVVTERVPPRRKTWKTVGRPRLVIMDAYEMGFVIAPSAGGSELKVWIDYELPKRGPARWAPVLAQAYADWCVRRMTADAVAAFGAAAPAGPTFRAARP